MKKTYTYALIVSLILIVAGAITGLAFESALSGPLLITGLLLLALSFRGSQKTKGYSYSVVIFSAVTAAMYYPAPFQQIGAVGSSSNHHVRHVHSHQH